MLLERFVRMLLKASLFLLLLSSLFSILERFAISFRFGIAVDWKVLYFGLVVILSGFLLSRFGDIGIHAMSERLRVHIRQEFLSRHPALKTFRIVYLSICSLFLVFSLSALGEMMLEHGGRVIASLVEAIGYYEIAERVFSRTPFPPTPDSSLSCWRSFAQPEAPAEERLRNAIVAKIYGNESPQLARRYQFVGSAHLKKGEYDLARQWYHKAFALYKSNRAYDRCLYELARIIGIELETQHEELAGKLIDRFVVLAEHCSTRDIEDVPLYFVATAATFFEHRETQAESLSRLDASVRESASLRRVGWINGSLLLFLAIAAIKTVSALSMRLIISSEINMCLRCLTSKNDERQSFELLNRLISLELSQIHLQKAHDYSVMIMSLVTGSSPWMSKSLVSQQSWPLSLWTLRKAFCELLCVALCIGSISM